MHPAYDVSTEPDLWRQEWQQLQPVLQAKEREQRDAERANPFRILRVNQLDAVKLEEEIVKMLKVQFLRIFQLAPQVLDRYRPELDAVLQLLVFRFSIYVDRPSPGNLLQNLCYRDERASRAKGRAHSLAPSPTPLTLTQKLLYALLVVGGRWAWVRVERMSMEEEWSAEPRASWRYRVWRALPLLESAFKAASLLNVLVFLFNGRYRSVVDRVLGMRLVYLRPRMARHVSFEYMNRQLVWHSFTELTMFLMQVVSLDRIKSTLQRTFTLRARRPDGATPDDDGVPRHVCTLCERPARTPMLTQPCAHRFCYYCLAAARKADPGMDCPRCHARITSVRRLTAADL